MKNPIATFFLIFLLGWINLSANGRERTDVDPSHALSFPEFIGMPNEERAVTNRGLTMVSSMAVANCGRLWVTWYAGPTPREDENNYLVLATSGDDGETWDEVLVVDPDEYGEPLRIFDSQVWIDPKGRLWLLWAQSITHGINAHTWAMITDTPDVKNPQWSNPRIIAPGVMMNKPTVLQSGCWLFPISDWTGRIVDDGNNITWAPSSDERATAQVWVSTNKGESFYLRGAALVPVEERTFDEHMFVERNDNSLWMLVRTRYGIGESISEDVGVTWTDLKPSAIPHPSARFFISRLQSGNLLLVKHGSMEEQTGRTNLTAFISKDDGLSWKGGLLLDNRRSISYPDGQQAVDGTIYITYDFDRTGAREILFATFREEDVLAGEDVTGAVRLRQLVSKGTGGETQKDDD